MAGHYGHETQTIQNLNVVSVDKENKLLLISGAIPGPKNSIVLIKSAIKPHKKTPTFNIYQNQASVEGENK
jgi:large subunit ribosomal protein L3